MSGVEVKQLVARQAALASVRRFLESPPATTGEAGAIVDDELGVPVDRDLALLLIVEFGSLAAAALRLAASAHGVSNVEALDILAGCRTDRIGAFLDETQLHLSPKGDPA